MKDKKFCVIAVIVLVCMMFFAACDILDFLLEDDDGNNNDDGKTTEQDDGKTTEQDDNNTTYYTLYEDFEYASQAAWNLSPWSGSASITITTQTAEAPGDNFFGNTTRFVKLPTVRVFGGGTTFLERRINLAEASALTFSFKTEIHEPFGQNFKVYINGTERGSWNGLNSTWRTETLLLNSGDQTIRFEVSSTGTSVSGGLNAVYMDNINIVPDVTDSLVLYPRGALNTYVGVPDNEKIQFRAEALRMDGSVRKNASGFVFSGAGVNSATGIMTPQTAGNTSITVSLDGKTASTDITVHPADFMRRPYFYPGTGKTYAGFSGTEGNRTNSSVTITYPSETTFNADGFFTLEGTVNNPNAYNYAYISLTKNSDPANLETTYFVRNNFKIRIWLRFGPGAYTIQVYNLSNASGAFDLNGDGDWTGTFSFGNAITFNVTNTRNDDLSVDSSIPDRRFVYPSYVVQSDDFRITNLAAELTFGLANNTEKIRAIHDYIVTNTAYDHDSLNPNQRKKQDAITVLGTRYRIDSQYPDGHFLAVCEGYSNLFAALARAAGFETRYVSSDSMNHGWNHIYVNGAWRFVDVTWNDPVPDRGPDFVRYDYFLLDSLNGDNSHTRWQVNAGRSLIGSPVFSWQYGIPEGWY